MSAYNVDFTRGFTKEMERRVTLSPIEEEINKTVFYAVYFYWMLSCPLPFSKALSPPSMIYHSTFTNWNPSSSLCVSPESTFTLLSLPNKPITLLKNKEDLRNE